MKNTLVRYDGSIPSVFDRDEFLTPFSSLFDDLFNRSQEFGVEFFGKGAYPKVDVSDSPTQITIEAEVPGLTKDQVAVEVQNGILTIKGTKQESTDTSSKKYVHKELKRSSFCRSFVIGDNIDEKNVNANFTNGILVVSLPKHTPDKLKEEVRKIQIT